MMIYSVFDIYVTFLKRRNLENFNWLLKLHLSTRGASKGCVLSPMLFKRGWHAQALLALLIVINIKKKLENLVVDAFSIIPFLKMAMKKANILQHT